jgi:hypothetical protein
MRIAAGLLSLTCLLGSGWAAEPSRSQAVPVTGTPAEASSVTKLLEVTGVFARARPQADHAQSDIQKAVVEAAVQQRRDAVKQATREVLGPLPQWTLEHSQATPGGSASAPARCTRRIATLESRSSKDEGSLRSRLTVGAQTFDFHTLLVRGESGALGFLCEQPGN